MDHAARRAFDLVILDEASQSDAREMPALLRGKKVLVVGDDRQVSPSAASCRLPTLSACAKIS
jgi:superfamily I DNA and/or RNA helicase